MYYQLGMEESKGQCPSHANIYNPWNKWEGYVIYMLHVHKMLGVHDCLESTETRELQGHRRGQGHGDESFA